MVSYAQLSKGLHEYIKANDLKNPRRAQALTAEARAASTAAKVEPQTTEVPVSFKKCKNCNAEIPLEAIFCDLCGVSQQ
jgi:hypothetical protein